MQNMIMKTALTMAVKNPNTVIPFKENGIKYRALFDPSEFARQNGKRLTISVDVSGEFIKQCLV